MSEAFKDAIITSIHKIPCCECEKLTHRQDKYRHIAVCSEKCWQIARPKYPIQRT